MIECVCATMLFYDLLKYMLKIVEVRIFPVRVHPEEATTADILYPTSCNQGVQG